MRKVFIKTIDIYNFKGIQHCEIEFDKKETIIKAKNGSGKTSIKNAWEWLIGVNVDGYIPKFNNRELEVETSVEAIINVNDYDYNLRKISKPKYTKGERVGNELKYYIDDIEYQPKNYLTQIASILTENMVDNIQILTDKDFFNSDSTKWKWTNRRQILMQMAGVYEKTKEIINKDCYALIQEDIVKGHSTSDLASQFRKDKKFLKDEQLKNQALIEQKQKEIDEYLGFDFDKIASELSIAKSKLTKLNNSSNDELKSEPYEQLHKELADETEKLTKLKTENALQLAELNNLKIKYYSEATQIKTQLSASEKEGVICPYCNQPLPEEMLTKIESNIKELKQKYNQAYENFNATETKIAELQQNDTINAMENKILGLKQAIDDLKITKVNESVELEKKSLSDTISDLELKMSRKKDLEIWGKQIKEWKLQSMDLADKVVDIETKERVLEDYMKEQTDIVINNINEMFTNGVSWSLYNQNYNGGFDEDCVAMFNGTTYSSLSTGEKYKLNMEVANTLQEYFGVNLPIWVDNCETITLDYETDRQLIKLFAVADENLKDCTKIKEIKL